MLIRFETENFLSFNERAELSLIASDVRTKKEHVVDGKSIKILKSAIIYGANAAGKSNLIKALDVAQQIIMDGVHSVSAINLHYRLNKANLNKPTVFSFEIKVKERYYSYGFGIILAKNRIVNEWLYELSANGEKKVFERSINDKGTTIIELGLKLDKEATTRFDVYREDFEKSSDQLFLSEINRKSLDTMKAQVQPFVDIKNFFEEQLVIIFPNSKYRALGVVGSNNELSTIFRLYLDIFQTGINDVVAKTEEIEKLNIPEEIKQELIKHLRKNTRKTEFSLFGINNESYAAKLDKEGNIVINKLGLEHESDENEKVTFDVDEESDGTQRLLDLIPALFRLAHSDKTYIIDEIDRSLHSKLTYSIFESFFQLSQSYESQLIATTHEALLLDLNLMRKDEIWFVEKESNSSKLYSLDQFKVRNDKSIRKDYLLGRYGAIPIFKSFQSIAEDESK